MIALTSEQARAISQQKEPLQMVHPDTQEVFVLVRQDVYELTRKILSKWDHPEDDDLIEAPHATR
jgi:hypothetical protein